MTTKYLSIYGIQLKIFLRTLVGHGDVSPGTRGRFSCPAESGTGETSPCPRRNVPVSSCYMRILFVIIIVMIE